MEKKYTYEEFLDIIARLRAKDGCPWDREQTHASLRKCMIEEAYETAEAIDNNDDENLKEELGDVLLQVVMHAQIASETQRFDMNDIIDGVSKKMIRRHPHIFGEALADSSAQVLKNWEAIKKQEKDETSVYEGVVRVPKALPANLRAKKILDKSADAGVDFADIKEVKDKLYKDLQSLEDTWIDGRRDQCDERFGDVMFDIINLSRFLDLNAENSLTNAIEKFINRLGSVENLVKTRGLELSELAPAELYALWENIKK